MKFSDTNYYNILYTVYIIFRMIYTHIMLHIILYIYTSIEITSARIGIRDIIIYGSDKLSKSRHESTIYAD